MTDRPRPNRPQPARNALSTGDFAILAIVVLVFLGVTILGCAVLWDVLNPGEWTADGWAAAGGWFAGVATVAAVWVALHQSRQARQASQQALTEARQLHAEQLRHEV